MNQCDGDLDRVSTGRGSDLVSDRRAIFLTILTPGIDQVATAPCTDPFQARFLTSGAKPLPEESLTVQKQRNQGFLIVSSYVLPR